jgi:hypothetical protein
MKNYIIIKMLKYLQNQFVAKQCYNFAGQLMIIRKEFKKKINK